MKQFHKYHGLGNDFIVMNYIEKTEELEKELTPHTVAALCQVKYGIGADGLVAIKSSENADFGMKLLNSDGSEAEVSGNGLRCLALYVKDNGLHNSDRMLIETMAGLQQVEIVGPDRVKVWMPKPDFNRATLPMTGEGECVDSEMRFDGQTFKCTAVSIGNPHCVIFEAFDVGQTIEWGPIIENSSYFPNRTNVEFVEIVDSERLKVIAYERGAGITQACGTGATASVAAGIKTGRLQFNRPYIVELLGGELTITIIKDFREAILEGEARKVFEGRIDLAKF